MEHSYWLGRKRASVANARGADGAQARLVHLELAGRYSIKAAATAPPASVIAAKAAVEAGPASLALPLPPADAGDAQYYERLETGARWLASRALGADERQEHLGMANKYARLRLEACGSARAPAPSAAPLRS